LEADDDNPEAKKARLRDELNQKLSYKINMVPRTGKGRFDVTVPVLFEF
jgi:hypothetical protein